MDIAKFYRLAPLPQARDPFAAADAERQLVRRLIASGYSEETAPVKVRALLRQLASAWGLQMPPGEDVVERTPEDGIQFQDGLELRRRYTARPLFEYEFGQSVMFLDEDGRWTEGVVGGFNHEGELRVLRPKPLGPVTVVDPGRVQPAAG